jgi:hypothetical protein
MTAIKIAGLLLILGFLAVAFASSAGPPGLFQEPKPEKRLQLIADHQGRWITSNLLFSLAGILTAAGLLVFSLQLRAEVNGWLNWGAAAAYGLGTLLWVWLMVDRTRNPEPYFLDYSFSPFTAALVALLVIGLLLYGLAFLAAGYPGWLGYGLAAGMLLIGALALFFPGRFFASFPPQLLYLFSLVAGIMMMRTA